MGPAPPPSSSPKKSAAKNAAAPAAPKTRCSMISIISPKKNRTANFEEIGSKSLGCFDFNQAAVGRLDFFALGLEVDPIITGATAELTEISAPALDPSISCN